MAADVPEAGFTPGDCIRMLQLVLSQDVTVKGCKWLRDASERHTGSIFGRRVLREGRECRFQHVLLLYRRVLCVRLEGA